MTNCVPSFFSSTDKLLNKPCTLIISPIKKKLADGLLKHHLDWKCTTGQLKTFFDYQNNTLAYTVYTVF